MQIIERVKKARNSFASILALSLVYSTPSLALDLKASEIRGETRKSPVSVLQNRYFTKTFRPEVGVAAGSFVNQAYTETMIYGARAALFFNEWLGVEFQSIQTNVADSDDRKALNRLQYRKLDSQDVVSPDPEVNSIRAVTDVNAIFAPFYGKLNLLDNIIIYSDLYLTGGVSKVATDQGDLNAISWGAGQRFYWKKNFSFRIDVRDRVYREIRNLEEYTKHSYSVDFGMSYFFF
ncbi:MAG: outer membrane beta-barrel domain-containing protein [Oligoflexus sp.]